MYTELLNIYIPELNSVGIPRCYFVNNIIWSTWTYNRHNNCIWWYARREEVVSRRPMHFRCCCYAFGLNSSCYMRFLTLEFPPNTCQQRNLLHSNVFLRKSIGKYAFVSMLHKDDCVWRAPLSTLSHISNIIE